VLNIVNPQPSQCKICGGISPLLGVVDFHKSCIEAQGKILNISGKPIYYRRCNACGFVFTEAFDDWSPGAFLKYIYNQDYITVDPDYAGARSASNAQAVEAMFPASRAAISVLDYGGGGGLFARVLGEAGFRATTYDPFSNFSARPQGLFELITCFEVMEHVPFPGIAVADMSGLLAAEGVILFSTLTQPANFEELGLRWWYVAPRNGHVSIYSRHALAILFEKHGLQLFSLSDLVHLAYRKLPAFAAHLVHGSQALSPLAKAEIPVLSCPVVLPLT
jgi:2-polyprenyl-6-hydroxyphenyl methylase/3-demethylubiquinone-9 3-methyltransferase